MTIVSCAIVAIAAVVVVIHIYDQPPIPAPIRDQVKFAILLPTENVIIDQTSYKYDRSQQILSFTGRLTDGQSVTFAEQATPEPFNDIPNFYQQLLQNMFEYESFDGLNGTVYLTHPKGAGQAAVINTKGTLVFARVARDETKQTWNTVFNDLALYTH